MENKSRNLKLTWTILFAGSIVALIVAIILLVNNIGAEIVHIVFVSIFGYITFFTFVLWLNVLITFRVRTRQYDGYTLLIYSGFKKLLIIEDQILDSGFVNRYLYGHLPNNKQVWTSISARDGSIKMGVGSEGDEKHLI